MGRIVDDVTTVELNQVATLAFHTLGLSSHQKNVWKPQYCTTNRVFAAGTLMFKRYRRRNTFLVETQILAARDCFSFRMPEIVFSLDDPVLGCWNVFHRIPGHNLIETIPQGGIQIKILDQMVDALVEFEDRVRALVDIRWTPWSLASGLKSLVEFCSHRGAVRTGNTLWQAAERWDNLLAMGTRAPCFDLYPRNVIWSVSKSDAVVSFIDFDKADRLVPRGEQLSHIAMLPGLKHRLKRQVKRYALHTGMDAQAVADVAGVASFFRALSGMRDSLPWNLLSERTSADPHAALRKRSFAYSLQQARKYLRVVANRSPNSAFHAEKLAEALSEIESIVRGDV